MPERQPIFELHIRRRFVSSNLERADLIKLTRSFS